MSLEKKNVKQLKAECRKNGLKGYSLLVKAGLIALLSGEMIYTPNGFVYPNRECTCGSGLSWNECDKGFLNSLNDMPNYCG